LDKFDKIWANLIRLGQKSKFCIPNNINLLRIRGYKKLLGVGACLCPLSRRSDGTALRTPPKSVRVAEYQLKI